MERFNQAADNNKEVILEHLIPLFSEPGAVLEVGSGSGQHAVHFAGRLGHLTWQCTEMPEYLEALARNIEQFASDLPAPVPLIVGEGAWPVSGFRYGYLANVLHIMAPDLMEPLFRGFAGALTDGGRVAVYGPFKKNGEFTTESNEKFDGWLRQQYPQGGIRDLEAVIAAAATHGFSFESDTDMPSNNQLLAFSKRR